VSSTINVYSPTETDFTTEGLGTLCPLSWEYKLEANDKHVLTLEHPYDPEGRWRLLQPEALLRADVPVRSVPEIQAGARVQTVEIWRVLVTATKAARTLYDREDGGRKRGVLPGGIEVAVTQVGEERTRVNTSSYGAGWIDSSALDMRLREVAYDTQEAVEAATPSVAARPQLFRIRPDGLRFGEKSVRVEAWHVFWDLLGNATDVKFEGAFTGQQLLDAIGNGCHFGHGFRFYTDIGDSRTGFEIHNVNPVAAILGETDSFVSLFGGELVLDNFDVYLLRRAGVDRGFRAAYGANLTGVKDCELSGEITTALIPVGKQEDGSPLYLDTEEEGGQGGGGDSGGGGYTPEERWVAAPNYAEHAIPYAAVLDVPEATVNENEGVSMAQAKMLMRLAVAQQWQAGVHLSKVSLQIDFARLGDSEEYKGFRAMAQCHLYDTVHVWHPKACGDVALDAVGLTWNGSKQRYTACTLGRLPDTLSKLRDSGVTVFGDGESGGYIIRPT